MEKDLVSVPVGDCVIVDVSIKGASLVVSETVDLGKVVRDLEKICPNAFITGGLEMLLAALGV